jgi:hypothetical protein
MARGLADRGIRYLWYFCHADNVASILGRGILCNNDAQRIDHRSFAAVTVQDRRHGRPIDTSHGRLRSVHDMVPLYLIPRTPTLYARRKHQNDLVFLRLRVEAVLAPGVEFAFSDGNVGAYPTRLYCHQDDLERIDFTVLAARRWNNLPDGKRKRNAEVLVDTVPPRCVDALVVRSQGAAARVSAITAALSLTPPVVVEPSCFF